MVLEGVFAEESDRSCDVVVEGVCAVMLKGDSAVESETACAVVNSYSKRLHNF